MILCLVTDRRRFASIANLLEQIEAAARAGVDFIQIRENDLDDADLVRLVRESVRRTEGTLAKVLVNDRLDVALASGAAGVHLKERSFSPAELRPVVPEGFVISCSVHSVDAAVARQDADLLVAGTVRPTASKPDANHLDEAGLRAIVAAVGKPVLGIGGLDLSTISLVHASGAAGMAGIGAFLVSGSGEEISLNVQKRVTALRFALETARRRT